MFLKNVVAEVLEQFPDEAKNLVFVASGRRPLLFLKKYFAEFSTKTTIAPEFISISDLLERISGLTPLNRLPLLFEFYDTYTKTCKTSPDDFETFIGWGQTLLKDFSEIDQYLIQPEKIFPYIHALKEAEHWSGADQLTEMQKKHLQFWNALGDYYFAFNEKLIKRQKGYAGLIARKAVELLPHYIQNNTDKIHIFVGFNALSKAEEKVIHSILMDLKSEIYWDIDRSFVEDKEHDAGFFIRKYLKNWRYYQFNKPKWLHNNYNSAKNINIVGVPKSINQAHLIADLLSDLPSNQLEKTALIVADENLLIPVLQIFKTEISVNITMGYPLQQTPLNDLFVAFFRLHLAKNFYHKDVLNLITQPFLQNLFSENGVVEISNYIKNNNLTYISREKILSVTSDENLDLIKILFPEKSDDFINELINSALALIYKIKQRTDTKQRESVLSLEYTYRFYLLFNQLRQLQNQFKFINSVKALYHFYLDILQKSSLDFVGEPLEGLQIMGVLESRSLDFENVIITSVNEGVIPLGKSGNSLIPYDVKFYLELPTYKERDAVYSYNFYRILQRASNIHLIYDTETNSLKGKEKSRFILQLLAEKNPKHIITHQIKAPEVYPVKSAKMVIKKTPQVMTRLKEMAENGLSPSALTNYILNPLVFYQQNVLQVYEERDVEETIEQRTFGDIVHATLEDLYRPYLNGILQESDFKSMKQKVYALIERHFSDKYKNSEFKNGKNLLIFNVINEYIHRFLDLELEEVKNGTEIVVLYLEQNVKTLFEIEELPFPVYFKGIIDRVDKRNGVFHVIDYKTGNVQAHNVGISDWERLISNFKQSKAFQLLTYAYMFDKQFGEQPEMIIGNFSFKKLNQGLIKFYTKLEGEKDKNYVVNQSVIETYKHYAKNLLLQIFDENIPFEQV